MGGQPRLTGVVALDETEVDRLAGEAICRVSAAFARDRSPKGMERALKENQVGVPEVDAIVARFARYRMALSRKGLAPCPESKQT